MKSTHDAALVQLSETENELAQSQGENARLRTGLDVLVSEVGVTAGKVDTMGTSLQKLQTDGDDIAGRLSEVQTLVTAQVAAIAGLGESIGPLKDEVQALRTKLAELAGRPIAPPAAAPRVAAGP